MYGKIDLGNVRGIKGEKGEKGEKGNSPTYDDLKYLKKDGEFVVLTTNTNISQSEYYLDSNKKLCNSEGYIVDELGEDTGELGEPFDIEVYGYEYEPLWIDENNKFTNNKGELLDDEFNIQYVPSNFIRDIVDYLYRDEEGSIKLVETLYPYITDYLLSADPDDPKYSPFFDEIEGDIKYYVCADNPQTTIYMDGNDDLVNTCKYKDANGDLVMENGVYASVPLEKNALYLYKSGSGTDSDIMYYDIFVCLKYNTVPIKLVSAKDFRLNYNIIDDVNVNVEQNQTTDENDVNLNIVIKGVSGQLYTSEEVDTLFANNVINKLGANNGIAQLDNNGKLPLSQSPITVDNNSTVAFASSKGGALENKVGSTTLNTTNKDLSKAVNELNTNDEKVANKTTSWKSSPNNTRYPTEKLVKDSLDSIEDDVSLKLGRSDIVDDLVTNDNTKVLSAKQGKVLYDSIQNIVVDDLEVDISQLHTHTSSQITDKTDSVTNNGTGLITSGGVYTALQNKVDKESGKGLSTNDYTSTEKTKLNSIENDANNYVHPTSVTAGTNYNGNQTPNFGATFNIPKLSFNAEGHITSSTNSTVKIPEIPFGSNANQVAMGNHTHNSLQSITISTANANLNASPFLVENGIYYFGTSASSTCQNKPYTESHAFVLEVRNQGSYTIQKLYRINSNILGKEVYYRLINTSGVSYSSDDSTNGWLRLITGNSKLGKTKGKIVVTGNNGNLEAVDSISSSQISDLSSFSTVATTGDYTDLTNKPNLSSVATSGNYNDLSNKPNLSSVATSGNYNDLSNKPNLSSVATSGNYNDLSNKPNLSSVATSGDFDDLINKPTLSSVATTGDYTDLTNKPTIPSKTSDLNNDSGFITNNDIMDTGWVDVQILTSNNIKNDDSLPLKIRRFGKVVHLEGVINPTANIRPNLGWGLQIGTINDSRFHPNRLQVGVVQGDLAKYSVSSLVFESGAVHIVNASETGKANNYIETNSWLPINMTWFVG